MVVQNNLNSLNAYDKLNVNVTGLKKSSEKLSSGYRINRAGDDAAGLAVSEKMRSQLKGLTQGVKNIQDGINLLQTADGALSTVHDMIHRLGELSEQAANGSYSLIERESIQQEVDEILDEIDQTSDYVVFNNKSVFGGSGGEGKTASAVSAAVSTATATVTSGNTPQPTTRSTLERNNAAMSALVADAPEETDFTPLMAMNDNVLKVRSYAAAPRAASSVQCGDLIVTGGVQGTDFKYENNTLTILSGTALEISGTTTGDKVYVESGVNANITMNNLNIKSNSDAAFAIADNSSGNVNITLTGTNSLEVSGWNSAALQKNDGSGKLTIGGSGKLTAIGGLGSAGIGSSLYNGTSNIEIIGGTIDARGGTSGDQGGAGIGGAYYGYASGITISGGNVKATGGKDAAGIGGGGAGRADITITGGTIEVLNEGAGAGIGSGYNGNGSANITISGGNITVKCTGVGSGGAAIGDGDEGWGLAEVKMSGGDVNIQCTSNNRGISAGSGGLFEIDGGTVTIRTDQGVGIGEFGTIQINKGTVDAASSNGTGIGKSDYLTIDGGNVTAKGGGDGAAIGEANYDLLINGGTVSAESKDNAVAIGSVYNTFEINGGDITAVSKGNGAAIGSKANSISQAIDITGGVISATSEGNGAAIGTGANCDEWGRTISITGGRITAQSKGGAGIGEGAGAYGSSSMYIEFSGDGDNEGAIVKAVSQNGPGIGGGNTVSGIGMYSQHGVVHAVSGSGNHIVSNDPKYGVSLVHSIVIEGNKGFAHNGWRDNDPVIINHDFTVESGVWIYSDGERTKPNSLNITSGTTVTNNGVLYFTLHDKLNIAGTIHNNGKIIFEYETEDEKKEIEESVKGVGGTIEYVKVDSGNPPEIPGPDPDPPGPDNPDPPDPPDPPGPDNPGGNTLGGSNGTGSGNGSDGGVTEWQSAWQIQVGARTKDTLFVEIGAMNTGILGIRGLDVTDQENANRAIDLTAAALNKISAMRSTIGAQQNRLEHKLSNTVNVKENLTGSESAIRDTEMAEEVLNNTKYKILLQASQIILMQSNEVPQSALQLLG